MWAAVSWWYMRGPLLGAGVELWPRNWGEICFTCPSWPWMDDFRFAYSYTRGTP